MTEKELWDILFKSQEFEDDRAEDYWRRDRGVALVFYPKDMRNLLQLLQQKSRHLTGEEAYKIIGGAVRAAWPNGYSAAWTKGAEYAPWWAEQWNKKVAPKLEELLGPFLASNEDQDVD